MPIPVSRREPCQRCLLKTSRRCHPFRSMPGLNGVHGSRRCLDGVVNRFMRSSLWRPDADKHQTRHADQASRKAGVGRGDDTVGDPHRAPIYRLELFEFKFINSSFSSLSCYLNYTINSLSSDSSQQYLNQQYPPPLSRRGTR